jgi:hypothetical protein
MIQFVDESECPHRHRRARMCALTYWVTCPDCGAFRDGWLMPKAEQKRYLSNARQATTPPSPARRRDDRTTD